MGINRKQLISKMKSTSIVEASLVGLGALGVFLIGIINLDNVPPPSFDEGWTLCVARQWVENGHYGCLFLGEFGPPYNSAHFPVVVPIALSFRIFGVGIWQARIVGLTFTVIDLILIYFLTRRLFNRRIAIGAAILALLHPVWNIQLLFLGRQVIGEIPAIFYLLAGCICFLYAQQKPWAAIPFTILFWGIALLTKKQVFPFWAAALAITLALVLARRQWRLGSVIAAAMIGSYAVSSILNATKRLLLLGHTLPHPPMDGQLQAQALVLDPDIRWATLKVALTFGLPTLLGLGYAVWKLANSHRIQEAGSSHEATKLILFLLASGWLGWYALLSIGWERYAFPPLFLANPFLAVLIYDATGGYSPQFVIKAARSVVANRRGNWQAITSVAGILLVAMIGNRVALWMQNIVHNSYDNGYTQTLNFLNKSTASDAVVESFESELFFLLERRYRYPLDVNLGPYDPLAASPDYVVVQQESWSAPHYLKALEKNEKYQLIRTFGNYLVYSKAP